jgi:hypothetical protein
MQPHADHESDVFWSYHWRDRALVEDLASALGEFGIKVFFDRWYLRPGRAWPKELEAAVSACQSVAVCVGPGEMGHGSSAR